MPLLSRWQPAALNLVLLEDCSNETPTKHHPYFHPRHTRRLDGWVVSETAKHTPGPWRWHDELILAGGNERIGLRVIAEAPGGFHFDTEAEKEANARRIAAAPDLLAACELSLKFYYQLYSPEDNREPAASLKAAITKATKGNES